MSTYERIYDELEQLLDAHNINGDVKAAAMDAYGREQAMTLEGFNAFYRIIEQRATFASCGAREDFFNDDALDRIQATADAAQERFETWTVRR